MTIARRKNVLQLLQEGRGSGCKLGIFVDLKVWSYCQVVSFFLNRIQNKTNYCKYGCSMGSLRKLENFG